MTAFSSHHDEHEPSFTNKGMITGVAISNKAIVILSTLGFGALGVVLFLILRRRQSTVDAKGDNNIRGRDVYGEMLDRSDVATLNRAQRKAKARLRMKRLQRAVAPLQHRDEDDEVGGQAQVMGDGDVMGENDGRNYDPADANLSRKERRKVAKVMEREERKAYANEARLWREKQQSSHRSESGISDEKGESVEFPSAANELSLEEVSPQSVNNKDALSDFLFWESIVNNIKRKSNSYDEMKSTAQHLRKVTIRQFIERLKENGSVPVATLADEFGITVPDTLYELEGINKRFGIIGVVDTDGNFVYISMEMIKKAIEYGELAGRVPCPSS
ncbi:hypothetical protein ACHAW5_008231 [Stephanodiscus triporus]|uniref:DDRGK domain-containing protein 1 n=1 Tax=Stephanodiscus triporus TaxID=2934178 RepID=A0ABD3PFI1_9STRA